MAIALLHVIELANEIAGRTATDSRHRAKALQIRTMAICAGNRFAAATADQRLAFLHASHRHEGGEAGVRIAQQFCTLGVIWGFDDALADGLFVIPLETQK